MLAAMVSVSGFYLNDAEKAYLEKYKPLGVSLFARNIHNKAQLKTLVNEIKEVIGRDDVLIAVDQEGGRVRRLREPEFQSVTSQYVLGQLPPEATDCHCILIAQDLHDVGINLNYAPVLDVAYPSTHPVLVSRCFSKDEKIVANLGKRMINGYLNHGICPCIKHLPGHGRAETDPHLGLPVINISLKELEKDFYPFRQNNQALMGMTAHIVVSDVDDKLPVTLSKKAIDEIIRGRIGFTNLLISDAIDMKALKGTIGEKAQGVIEAGSDVVCYCGGLIHELYDLAEYCPNISDKALYRFEKIKKIIKLNRNDFEDVADKYYSFTGKVEEYNETYDATEVLHKMNKQGE